MAIAIKLNGANNYNVLPFYSSKEYWHSKRWYTYGQICPVAARKDYLVPFQLYFTRDVVSTSGNITLDIKRVNDDFTVKSFTLNHSFIHTPEYVIIKFPEQQITALPLGLYYYKVTYQETNDSGIAQGEALEAYSDIISIMDDESDFVRLEYWNASDIITNGYTISFADNFKFVSYIHSTIAKPDYEFEEELTKRLGYKFIETQVSTKVYKFNFLATEANCDAMRIARMCDYIKFTTSLDVYNALYMSFEVAWQDYGDVANLTVEFETDTIIQRLESFKRSDVANFYNALLYNINEPILFDYDTIAQYYSDFSGQGKMIRELDQITVDDITSTSTMPIDLGQGAAKKIAIEEIFSKYSAFNEYFGFDEVNNAVYVKGNRSFYTMPLGDIIAGGYDESPGSVVKVERLTDIGDVRPDSLNANDLLKYDGTNWVTIPLASISSKIDKLTDINDVTPINLTAGDLLKYDGSKWVNIPMASISGKVEGITVNNSNYYPEPVTKLITLPDLAIPIKNMADASAAELTVGSKIAFMTAAGQDRRATLESIFNLYSQLHGFFELDTVNNAIKVKEGRTLYTDGEIVAGGYGEGSGGTAIERLTDIGDVVTTNLATGDLLKYDGTNWVNIPMTNISGKVEGITVNNSNYYPEPVTKLITLPNYPTTLPASDVYSWAKQPNKPSYSFDELSSHPTTLGGYGITDAYTKSDADGRFFRYFGYTTDDGDDFMWQKLGTFTYLNAFPDGVTIKRHGYGQVTSFIAGPSRFQLYSTHSSSDPNDGPNGIQFRSGWDDDKKSWRMLLDEVNYLHYTDNRYVNKAGDTMTGTLLMSNDSDIYGRSSANSDAAYIIGYRDATISGIVMHDISAANNTKALYIQTNGYDAPSDTGGLAITNDCVTAFGSGDNGSVFRVLNEDDVNLGALFNVAKDGTLTRLGNRIWDAGNDGSGSGLDADLLDGYHYYSFESYHKVSIDTTGLDNNTWYPVTMSIGNSLQTRIRVQGNTYAPGSWNGREDKRMSLILDYTVNGSLWGWTSARRVINEIQDGAGAQGAHCIGGLGQLTHSSTEYVYVRGGAVYDFYVDRFTNPVLRTSTYTIGDQSVSPQTSYSDVNRTNALLTDNVYSATKLQTPRYIFGKPFDGTGNVTGGAKFANICIETDNNGNDDSERISEINNYNSILYLQHVSPNNLICCMGGGNVGIGSLSTSGKKLYVNGDIGVSGTIYFETLSAGNERDLLYQQMADNDLFRIRCGGPSNQGWVEIATADDGTEPIYVRQYTGKFASITRTLTLLDGSGNTHVPGNFYATGEVAAGSASDLRLKEIQKRPSYANRLLKMGLVRDYYFNDLAKSRDVRKVDNDLHTGMIYQDVLPVLSSMCGVDDDGYGKLNYIKPDFICTIAGATQDNTIELIKVNTRMSKLETAIRHLKRKINKLERKLSYEQASIQ